MPKASTRSKADAPAKREKKVKDPNAPKKPCGAYMWFCKDRRESIKKEFPTYSTTQIGQQLGLAWKEITEEEKAKFHKQAQQDKVRYAQALAEYEKTKDEEGEEEEEEDDE